MGVLEAFLSGRQARAAQDVADRENALQSFLQQNGQALFAGDQNALGQLAGLDPQMALGIQSTQMSMAATQSASGRAAAEWARARSAEEVAAEAAKTEALLKGAAYFHANGDRPGYENYVRQQGGDPAEFPFEQFPAIAAAAGEVLDVWREFQPQAYEPMSPEGKLNADVRAGAVPPPQAPRPMTAEERAWWQIPRDDTRPYALVDGKPALIGGGGMTIENNIGSDSSALAKKLSEAEGTLWGTYLEQGSVSAGTAQDMQLLDELIQMAPQGPIVGRVAGMFPGFNSAASAFESVVKRVAPTLRAPGSGSTSDIEYDGMLKSLPQLRSRPEANAAVAGMMRAKAQLNIARANIVRQFQNGEMPEADARRAIQEIDQRSIMTPELSSLIYGLAPGESPPTDGLSEAARRYLEGN